MILALQPFRAPEPLCFTPAVLFQSGQWLLLRLALPSIIRPKGAEITISNSGRVSLALVQSFVFHGSETAWAFDEHMRMIMYQAYWKASLVLIGQKRSIAESLFQQTA